MHLLFAILFLLSPFHGQLNRHSKCLESWAAQKISLNMPDATVKEVVARLHDSCVPVSFIESSESGRISLSVHDARVDSILKKLQAQAPEYTYEVINARPVLYPREEKFQVFLQNGDASTRPRLEAADKLAAHLRQTISGFDGLVVAPVVTLGGSRFPIHDTLVDRRKEGRVIEHLVDLLGSDPKLHLAFKTVRLNYYFLDFRHVDCNTQAVP